MIIEYSILLNEFGKEDTNSSYRLIKKHLTYVVIILFIFNEIIKFIGFDNLSNPFFILWTNLFETNVLMGELVLPGHR